jgi:hypothetical protein
MIEVKPEDKFMLAVTGLELQVLVTGLGELPHKIAGPVEGAILKQVEEQAKKPE